MSTVNKIEEERTQNNNVKTVNKPMENLDEVDNLSSHLNTSHNSTISNDSEVSSLSLSLEKEIESNANAIDIDELPAFEIRLISPLGRTPSPIDSEDIETPTRSLSQILELLTPSPCENNPDYVALHEINAQISPPSEQRDENGLSRTPGSLETIFEGVFLNTPPRQRHYLQNNRQNRSQTNILEKVAINRLNFGKENQSPSSKSETNPSQQTSIDINRIQDACNKNTNYCLL